MDYSSTSGGLMASSSRLPARAETRPRTPTPQNEQAALKCPRCESTRTKFCYYNNYSLSQPRYFCKTCRRYWTKGGSLRNVPVGGGCRKNSKRPHPVVKKTDEPLGRAPALVMGSGATDLQRHRPSFAAPIGLDTEDTTSMMQRSTRSLYFMGNDGIIGFQAASRLGITSATNTLGVRPGSGRFGPSPSPTNEQPNPRFPLKFVAQSSRATASSRAVAFSSPSEANANEANANAFVGERRGKAAERGGADEAEDCGRRGDCRGRHGGKDADASDDLVVDDGSGGSWI